MAIIIFKDDNKNFMLFQSNVANQLNPILRNPLTNTSILKEISLTTGSNTINHLLGKKLQGWYIVRQRSAASIFDTQDSNPQPQLTLTLTTSADVVCDVAVF